MGKKNSIIPGRFSATLSRLWGALISGKRSAYLAMLIKLVKPLTLIAEWVLSLFAEKPKSLHQFAIPIMIVSPPRGGATIIYQSLVRVLPSLFISNLHALCPKHASKWIYKRDGRIPFRKKNYYGYTASLFDVYEGNEFIDPVFEGTQAAAEINNRFRNLLKEIKARPTMPFVFKNARNYDNIALLSKALSNVIFIRIKRDHEQVIQSEYRAYKELKTFHPIPDTLKDSKITDPLEFTAHQIMEIEKEIDRQKALIDPDRWIEWEYEAFCEDPIGHIRNLAVNKLNIPESELRPECLTYKLQASDRKKVSDEEAKRIRALINVINKD